MLNTTLYVSGVGFSVAGLNREKIQILSISKLLFTFVIVRDRTRMKSPLRWLKNIGMVSEKLYRNMLKETESYSLSYSKNSCAYHAPTESIGR